MIKIKQFKGSREEAIEEKNKQRKNDLYKTGVPREEKQNQTIKQN